MRPPGPGYKNIELVQVQGDDWCPGCPRDADHCQASSFDTDQLGEIITLPGGSVVPAVFQYGQNAGLLAEFKVSLFALHSTVMMDFLFSS